MREVTDEMEDAARREWAEGHDDMKRAIAAALAVMPDQYLAGWIAGRDAVADLTKLLRDEAQKQFDSGLPASVAVGVATLIAGLKAHEKYIRKQEPPA